jgi:hypothetical protein
MSCHVYYVQISAIHNEKKSTLSRTILKSFPPEKQSARADCSKIESQWNVLKYS